MGRLPFKALALDNKGTAKGSDEILGCEPFARKDRLQESVSCARNFPGRLLSGRNGGCGKRFRRCLLLPERKAEKRFRRDLPQSRELG